MAYTVFPVHGSIYTSFEQGSFLLDVYHLILVETVYHNHYNFQSIRIICNVLMFELFINQLLLL